MKKILILLPLMIIALAGMVCADTWTSDSDIISGLSDVGDDSAPTVFYKDSTWYLIAGEHSGVFNGYNWTGSTWQSDSGIISGLGDVVDDSSPTVFYKDGYWYLISGRDLGTFKGYNWTGSTWQSDSGIISGLGDIGSDSSPTVFYKDSTWYLISGEYSGVSLNGYNWTGSTWTSYNAIKYGVAGVTYSSPTVFYKDSTWYLINGKDDGAFRGYNWTGSWTLDSNIYDGLGDVGSNSAPTVFYKDGYWYLISGNLDGTFSGYSWPVIEVNLLTMDPEYQEGNETQSFMVNYTYGGDEGLYNHTMWYVNDIYNSSWDNQTSLDEEFFDRGDYVTVEFWMTTNETNISSPHYNATATSIGMNDCSNSTAYALNVSLFNENDRTESFYGDMDVEGGYYEAGEILPLFNFSYDNQSTFSLCIDPVSGSFSGDLYMKYHHESEAGNTNNYYLINTTFSNDTQLINAYVFNDSINLSTLSVTVRNASNYVYLSGIVGRLQRKYNGIDEWITVQMSRSGDFGQLLYKVREEDTDYRLIFLDEWGRVIQTGNSMKFFCIDDYCELTYLLNPYSPPISDTNLSITSSYNNETGIINVSWIDPDGSDTTIDVSIIKELGSGSSEICSEVSESTSGSITCNMTGHTGMFIVRADSTTNGIANDQYSTFYESVLSKLGSITGTREGSIWAVILSVTIIGMGLFSPIGAIYATIIAMIIVSAFGLLNVLTGSVLAIAAIIGIIVGIQVKK